MDTAKANKQHRQAKSGPSKKGPPKIHSGKNPKAFAPTSGRNAERMGRRNMDRNETRLHVPLVDRTTLMPPPVVVAVVGPPGTGKTSLIKSLVKRYTRHNLSEIHGPITVVAGKTRRLTFIECNNDINSMVDVGKVADLVLLMIDASFGFEMETFEFLNVLQTHGFPKVMGVLTHLDKFKDSKRLRKTKKTLKQRFWTEIYQGAKLFYLSGMINGKYLKNEVMNLSRFISVIKFRPLVWRNTHPYLVADRMEDLTSPEQIQLTPKCDRTVALYGYLRGTNLKANTLVHIPGVGDHRIAEISILTDPCPIPDKERKMLSEKAKLLYAPMSDVGGIRFDKDAVYINVPGQFSRKETNEEADLGERLVFGLQDASETIQDKVKASSMRIFGESELMNAADFVPEAESEEENEQAIESEDDGDLSDLSDSDTEDVHFDESTGRTRRRVKKGIMNAVANNDANSPEFAEDSDLELSENDNDEDDVDLVLGGDGALTWKNDVLAKAEAKFKRHGMSLYDFVYKTNWSSPTQGQELDEAPEERGGIFTFKKHVETEPTLSTMDASKVETPILILDAYASADKRDDMARYFITSKQAPAEEPQIEEEGDFEDLEAPESANAAEYESEAEEPEVLDIDQERAANAKRKEELKQKFDANYDGDEDPEKEGTYYEQVKADMAEQIQTNRAEFEGDDPETRAQIEGYQAGTYVRLLFNSIPCEFSDNFDPDYPILAGGLLSTEEAFGFIQVRIKKHRWHKKILKTNDPLIFSLGWRRFQTMPLYSLNNDATRNRMLKYTPEHMHCLATFYGPITPQNTGFCCLQSVSDRAVTER